MPSSSSPSQSQISGQLSGTHGLPSSYISKVFGRTTNAIVAATGDYTAAQVTNAADKASAAQQTFVGNGQFPSIGVNVAPPALGHIQVAGLLTVGTLGSTVRDDGAGGLLMEAGSGDYIFLRPYAGTNNYALEGIGSWTTKNGSGATQNTLDDSAGNAIFAGTVKATRFGSNATPPTVSGTVSSAPPSSATIQTALGNLVLGTAYQNTLSYDVYIQVFLSITVNTSGVVSLGVGSTNTPTQSTIVSGVTTTGFIPVKFKIPAGYYALLSTSGTVTDSIAGQYLEAV